MPTTRGDRESVPSTLSSIITSCLRHDEQARPTAVQVLASLKTALYAPVTPASRSLDAHDALPATGSAVSGAPTADAAALTPTALVSEALSDPGKRDEFAKVISRWLDPRPSSLAQHM